MNMELVLATHNQDKAKEIRDYLSDLDLKVLTLDEFGSVPEVVEDGATYEENAKLKAFSALAVTGKMVVADDTGLEVDALDGQPGLYSARYAGEKVSYGENCQKLLAEMRDIPSEKRTARFRCVMVLAMPDGKSQSVEGVIEGLITQEEIGDEGFGYDPVFLVPEQGKTFAQLPAEEKNRISHRARALHKLRELLKPLL